MSKAVIAVDWHREDTVYNGGVEEKEERPYSFSVHLSKADAHQYIKERKYDHGRRFKDKCLYLALITEGDYGYLKNIWYQGKLGYEITNWMVEDVSKVEVEDLESVPRYVKLLGSDDLTKTTLTKMNGESE